jgi:oxygen-independent coproporphyrinogen-3 oxidase
LPSREAPPEGGLRAEGPTPDDGTASGTGHPDDGAALGTIHPDDGAALGTVHPDDGALEPTLCLEIGSAAELSAGRVVETVFVGGGTPTVLAPLAVERILDSLRNTFRVAKHAEVTCEANPGSSDRGAFAGLRAAGVNRLSIGVQSIDEDELAFLGRIHGAGDARQAVEAAREAGFDNVSLDLMFGLPGQEMRTWRRTLAEAVALSPEHLSLYSLVVEPDTPLADWIAGGTVAAPDEDIAADHYEHAIAFLRGEGYVHYEVSNWARPGGCADAVAPNSLAPARACRHNMGYWRNGEYIGFGPGSHSHLRSADGSAHGSAADSHGDLRSVAGSASDTHVPPSAAPGRRPEAGRRWSNVRGVDEYVALASARRAPVAFEEQVSPRQAMGETMLLGLRLLQEGVTRARFTALHGVAPEEAFGAEIDRLVSMGLLDVDQAGLRLTANGLIIGNQVFAEFVE